MSPRPWRRGGGPPCGPPPFGHREQQSRLGHRWREGVRHYTGAHLRRRLFLWFGAAIFLTILVVAGVQRLFGDGLGHRPPRGLVVIVVPALVLWILSGKVARRIARPLDELVRVSDDIGRGNLGARADLSRHGIDEIAVLGRSINDMASRIQRQLADQRELLAAVSHELRTPLARLRVLVDIARERGAGALTWDEIERELLEMDTLVAELLASARLEFQALGARPLDAVEVARRALERAGLPPELLVGEVKAAPFSGDPTLVARALANLLDNAAKHGGGVVAVRVGRRPGFVWFDIEDAGPGLRPEVAAGVFQPFVRTEAPPLHGGHGTSLGLGLSLVARIARAHGGRVEAGPLPHGPPGARLRLELAEAPTPAGEPHLEAPTAAGGPPL